MTGPYTLGQTVHMGAGRLAATVTVTWRGGRRAIAETPDANLITLRVEDSDRPAIATSRPVDLAAAEAIALCVLAGDSSPGSVTDQMLTLAAAVIALLDGAR